MFKKDHSVMEFSQIFILFIMHNIRLHTWLFLCTLPQLSAKFAPRIKWGTVIFVSRFLIVIFVCEVSLN